MSEQEKKDMQGSMDLIHHNMQDTLVQKKKLSSLDEKAREAKREMKRKNRYFRLLISEQEGVNLVNLGKQEGWRKH
jgi:hypothetical protein